MDDAHVEALIEDLEAALNENALLRPQLAELTRDVRRLREQLAYVESIRAPLKGPVLEHSGAPRRRRWWTL